MNQPFNQPFAELVQRHGSLVAYRGELFAPVISVCNHSPLHLVHKSKKIALRSIGSVSSIICAQRPSLYELCAYALAKISPYSFADKAVLTHDDRLMLDNAVRRVLSYNGLLRLPKFEDPQNGDKNDSTKQVKP